MPVNVGMRAPSEVNLAPQTTSMKTYKRVYCFFVICLSFLNSSNCGGKKSFSEIIEGRNQGVYNRERGAREDDRNQSDSWRQGRVASTQKKKGREYKEVSRLAEIASQRREEKETLIVFADCFDLQSDRFSVGRETLPPAPAPIAAQGQPGCDCWEISWRYQSEHCQGLL